MLVLVTRPLEEAEALAALLKARGVECLIEPMLAIRPLENPVPTLDGVQALLFTSANGVRAFAINEKGRDLPVFAIGERTAEAAREAGFAKIESAAGAVEELAALVRARLDPKKGALLHGAGTEIRGDLAGLLEPQGFEIRRVALYEAIAATALSGVTVTSLRDGRIDAALFFSPRTAGIFVNLAKSAGVEGACAALTAYCLSAAVAESAQAVRWRAVRVAARPERSALLALLDEAPAENTPVPGTPGAASDPALAKAARTGRPEKRAPENQDQDSAALRAIRAFGGIRPMASKLGVPVTTVQGWRERGHIPAARIGDLRAAAAIHGVELDGVDLAAAASLDGTAAAATSSTPTQAMQASSDPSPPSPPAATNGAAAASQPILDLVQEVSPSPAPPAAEAPPRRVGLVAAFWAAAFVAVLIAASVSLPYWGPRLGISPNPAPAARPPEVVELQKRLAALESLVADLTNRPAPGNGAADGAKLAELAQELAQLKDANAKLAADGTALRQQLDAVAQQARKSSEAESRRAALLLAVGQLQEALSRSAPYDQALAAVAALGDDDGAVANAVATLKVRAATGVPNVVELAQGFDNVAMTAARAAIVPTQPGLLGTMLARLRRLIVIRRTGDIAGDGPDGALARADAFLKARDLAAAVKALEPLDGPAAAAVKPWMADAQARLDADAAVAALAAHAVGRLGESRS